MQRFVSTRRIVCAQSLRSQRAVVLQNGSSQFESQRTSTHVKYNLNLRASHARTFTSTPPSPVSNSADATTATATAAASSFAPGPLAGIKVLDLSRILAGPFCTQILGDMGAEIWKIENPQFGDDTRFWGPPFVKSATTPVIASSKSTANTYVSIGESAYFLAANRNKSSICINIKTEAGRDLVRALARQADVLVENYLPGKLDELGLGYTDLRQLNPSLIYASLTGFGRGGPMSHSPGYDVMASARGGLMNVTGAPPPMGSPAKVGVAVTDLASGLYLHGAILAALFARERDPQRRGQRVETNLLEVQVASLANLGQNQLVDPTRKGTRWGTAHESIVPYQAFACLPDLPTASSPPSSTPTAASPIASVASAHFICGALNNKQFIALGSALSSLCAQRPSLGLDASFMSSPLYAQNALRVKNRISLLSSMQEIFTHFTVRELLAVMETHDIPAAPINDLAQVFDDPQVRHSGIVQTVQHPGVGNVKVVGPPVHYSETPARISSAPPMLGQHTQQILQQVLGSSVQQMQEWEQQGVIGCYDQIK